MCIRLTSVRLGGLSFRIQGYEPSPNMTSMSGCSSGNHSKRLNSGVSKGGMKVGGVKEISSNTVESTIGIL